MDYLTTIKNLEDSKRYELVTACYKNGFNLLASGIELFKRNKDLIGYSNSLIIHSIEEFMKGYGVLLIHVTTDNIINSLFRDHPIKHNQAIKTFKSIIALFDNHDLIDKEDMDYLLELRNIAINPKSLERQRKNGFYIDIKTTREIYTPWEIITYDQYKQNERISHSLKVLLNIMQGSKFYCKPGW